MADRTVLVEIEEGVATVTLNRPEKPALAWRDDRFVDVGGRP